MNQEITFDDKKIYPCLTSEKRALQFKRSTVKIVKNKDKITFKIKAQDTTALKASKYSINNLITVYKKIKDLVQNE